MCSRMTLWLASIDGEMEFGVELGLVGGVSLGMGGLHLFEDRVDDLEIGVRAVGRRTRGGDAFEIAAEGDVIEDGLGVGREEPDERGRKGRAQHVGHVDASAGARRQKPARLQFRDRFPQAGAGDAETFAELAFRG